VNLWSTNRRTLLWFTLPFVGLALSVFTWGLQYKLSLYDPPDGASHGMPQAKLLSEAERVRVSESPLLRDTRASAKVMCAVVVSACFFCLLAASPLKEHASGQRRREANRPWYLGRRAGLNAFFFRPPPTLA
jgi:hypothetical protein